MSLKLHRVFLLRAIDDGYRNVGRRLAAFAFYAQPFGGTSCGAY